MSDDVTTPINHGLAAGFAYTQGNTVRPPRQCHLPGGMAALCERNDAMDSNSTDSTPWTLSRKMDRWCTPRFISEVGACWSWRGTKTRGGYGRITIGRRSIAAHRVFYNFFIADIPDGLEIDHLCRNRACVNPWHLEPVTHKVNMERAVYTGKYTMSDKVRNRVPVLKPDCSKGHLLTKENTYRDRRGGRNCRICNRDRARRNAAEKIVEAGTE